MGVFINFFIQPLIPFKSTVVISVQPAKASLAQHTTTPYEFRLALKSEVLKVLVSATRKIAVFSQVFN